MSGAQTSRRTSGGEGVGLQLGHGGRIAMRVPRGAPRVSLGPGDSKGSHSW